MTPSQSRDAVKKLGPISLISAQLSSRVSYEPAIREAAQETDRATGSFQQDPCASRKRRSRFDRRAAADREMGIYAQIRTTLVQIYADAH